MMNNNNELRNTFIERIQIRSNNQELLVNKEDNHISQSFIDSAQTIIRNDSNINNFITSIILNHPNQDEIRSQPSNTLSNFNNDNNYNHLITRFLNSFYIFLRSNIDDELITLEAFYASLNNISTMINTVESTTNLIEIFNNNIEIDVHIKIRNKTRKKMYIIII